ncbi:unnamed protein product [Bursaphelenchus xylophilus]|uniref:Splicing factor 45 n=1 Tax=Bursaphelenchus xylophilus TaxID=6326 RepID=A0A1I7RI17_BURXY|nr:unnamed protein product [Bursaphelenchus xylophilus]CAG9115221.1 unnamed protein product [Bursaphelenchus xylophilus]
MSLYDDILPGSSDDSKPESEAQPKTAAQNFLFLKQQLEAKKAQAQQSKVKPKASGLSNLKPQVPVPVVQPKPNNILKPRRAKPLPLDAPPSFSIIPQAVKEEKVILFNEVEIVDEYNPLTPTDYNVYKPKRELQLAKERIAKEIAERLAKEHAEEERKRKIYAQFAPPQALIEDSTVIKEPQQPVPVPRPVKRGLDLAADIMSKMGYKEGKGLGKDETGISSALRVEKRGRNVGMIVDGTKKSWDRDENGKFISQKVNLNTAEMVNNASKVILVKNMVTPSDCEDEIQEIVEEEMSKYGTVVKVVIHEVQDLPENESIRIFVEFTNQAQAMKAVIDLSKRYYGGRALTVSFFDVDKYINQQFDDIND